MRLEYGISASHRSRLILPWAFYQRTRKRRQPAQYNRWTFQNAEQIIMAVVLNSEAHPSVANRRSDRDKTGPESRYIAEELRAVSA